jgi:hypothetical protein
MCLFAADSSGAVQPCRRRVGDSLPDGEARFKARSAKFI